MHSGDAIDALDDLLHNAKLVPLSDDARLDPQELHDALQRVRRGLEIDLRGSPAARSWQLLAQMEELARTARSLPLTRKVRVRPDAFYELLDELRAALPAGD